MWVTQRLVWCGNIALLALELIFSTPAVGAGETGRQLLTYAAGFPYNCSCYRSPNAAPFALGEVAHDSVNLYQRYCFHVTTSRYCNPKLTECCDGKQGISKIEFEIEPSCSTSVQKVTINDSDWGSWTARTPTTLRITNLGRGPEAAVGTEICLFLRNGFPCTRLDTFCTLRSSACRYSIFNDNKKCCPANIAGSTPFPPRVPAPSPGIFPSNTRYPPRSPKPPSSAPFPAPPSPPSPHPPSPKLRSPNSPPPYPPAPKPLNFPKCSCIREQRNSQIFVYPLVEVSLADEIGYTKLCFKVGTADTCATKSRCCQFELYKAEFEADPACVGSLAYMTLNGAKCSRFFQLNPYAAIKLTNIDKPFSSLNGTAIYLVLKSSECGSLASLGKYHDGSITVSLFNKPGTTGFNCCPTGQVAQF